MHKNGQSSGKRGEMGNIKEKQLRKNILKLVGKHCEIFHNKPAFKEGDRISYGGRIFDKKELTNLVDASLDFWLTTGKYSLEFEKKLSAYLKIEYCSLVNSGSSANLLAFIFRSDAPNVIRKSNAWFKNAPEPQAGSQMVSCRSQFRYAVSLSAKGCLVLMFRLLSVQYSSSMI